MTNKSDQREQHEHFTTILTRECSQNIDLRIFEWLLKTEIRKEISYNLWWIEILVLTRTKKFTRESLETRKVRYSNTRITFSYFSLIAMFSMKTVKFSCLFSTRCVYYLVNRANKHYHARLHQLLCRLSCHYLYKNRTKRTWQRSLSWKQFFFQNSLTLCFIEFHLIYIHRENIVCVHHIEYSAWGIRCLQIK